MENFMQIWFIPIIIGVITGLISSVIILISQRDELSKNGPRIIAGAIVLSILLGIIAALFYNYFRYPIVEVPKVIGMDKDVAIIEIEDRDLVPVVKEKHDSSIPKLQVISQDPWPGTKVKRNSEVEITVCSGSKPKLPDGSSSGTKVIEPKSQKSGSELSLRITEPIRDITSTEKTEWIRFSVRGILGGNKSYKNVGIYVLVYPENPFGGGWYIQKPKATIDRRDGKWFANAQLGAKRYPVTDGDTFRIAAVATNEISVMDELSRVESLQDLPEHIRSDIIDLTVRRPRIQSYNQQSSEQITITHINDLPISHSIHIRKRHYLAKGVVISSTRRDDLHVVTYAKPPSEGAFYIQDDMQRIFKWERQDNGLWKGEWEVGGYIGREGMDYDMKYKVWAVVVDEDEINNLSNFYGSIGRIRESAPGAVWSEYVTIIKKP